MSCPRTTLALILGCLFVTPAHGQQGACPQRTIPVSIFSRDGTIVPQVGIPNIDGTYRNKPVHVKSLGPADGFSRVVLLIDTSASMRETLNENLDLAELLLSKMPPAAQVGLAFFSQNLQPVNLPTNDRAKLKDQLDALRTHPKAYKGKTAFWDSIGGSLNMFGRPQFGDTVFVITDGNDNQSNKKPGEVFQLLEAAGVRLFAAQLPDLVPDFSRAGYSGMVQYRPATGHPRMTEDTGGELINHQIPLRIGFSFDEQYRQIFSLYRLEIDLPGPVDKPQAWKLDLVGLSKSQRDNMILMYPHKLMPCH